MAGIPGSGQGDGVHWLNQPFLFFGVFVVESKEKEGGIKRKQKVTKCFSLSIIPLMAATRIRELG